MTAMMSFATLAIATLLAAGAAVLLDWLLLRAVFHLMPPAAARPSRVPSGQVALVHGTVRLVRAYSAQR
jgi:hypothetical protein